MALMLAYVICHLSSFYLLKIILLFQNDFVPGYAIIIIIVIKDVRVIIIFTIKIMWGVMVPNYFIVIMTFLIVQYVF